MQKPFTASNSAHGVSFWIINNNSKGGKMSKSKKLTPEIKVSKLEEQAAFLQKIQGNHSELIKFFQAPQEYCKAHNIHLSPGVMTIINNQMLADDRLAQHASNLGPVTDGFLASVCDAVAAASSAVAAGAAVVAARAATAATAAAPAVAEAAEAVAPVVAEAAEATAVAAAVA